MKSKTILLVIVVFGLTAGQWILGQNSIAESCMVVGHRGSSKIAPENTIAAANLAWEQMADAVEVDVHLSSDNQVVVIHDYDTKRTCGEMYKISETPYEILSKLDAGSWKSEVYKGERIPLLKEIVDIIPDGQKLVVEIKSDKKIVPYIHQLFKDHPKRAQLIFIAFNYETILDAKKAFPDNKAFWLSGSFKEEPEQIFKKVKEDGLDGVDLHHRLISQEVISSANKLGLEVHVWTVDDLEQAKELKQLGVNSITTNVPDLVLKTINSK